MTTSRISRIMLSCTLAATLFTGCATIDPQVANLIEGAIPSNLRVSNGRGPSFNINPRAIVHVVLRNYVRRPMTSSERSRAVSKTKTYTERLRSNGKPVPSTAMANVGTTSQPKLVPVDTRTLNVKSTDVYEIDSSERSNLSGASTVKVGNLSGAYIN